ncbi:MAG: alpha/beta hydrolase [Clostridia bacterium]|nr:alpha/beta hydrolase [Clostridia bacterium]
MEHTVSDWLGFERWGFRFEERDALLVFPHGEKNGHVAVKMEYFGAFPNLEEELLRRGWCIAYLSNINRWGTDADSDAKARFLSFLQSEFGLDGRAALVGMSCGGLCSVNFAAKYPALVSVLYLDAPVMNLYSCPMGFGEGDPLGGERGWEELVDAYGFTRASFLLYREHPVDKIGILAEHKIPVALIYGDADRVVPYPENGAPLEALYRSFSLPLFCVGKPGCGHHPHGLEDPTPLADFIEKYA